MTGERRRLLLDASEVQQAIMTGKLVKLTVEPCPDRPGYQIIGSYAQVMKVIDQLKAAGIAAHRAPWSFEQKTWLTMISEETYQKHPDLVEGWMNEPPQDVSEKPEEKQVAALDFDSFLKVELVAGTITSAERIPKKDKLLKLAVDLGEPAPRTIVAGLGQSFTPEQLVGQQVVVVANLAPRDFGKGLVSHGMILATGDSANLSLAKLGASVPNGSRLK